MSRKLVQILDRFEEAVRTEAAAARGIETAKEIHADALMKLTEVREEMENASSGWQRTVLRKKAAARGNKKRKKAGKSQGSGSIPDQALDLLSDGEIWTATEILESLEATRHSVNAALSRLAREKTIKRVGYGRYRQT